MLKNGGNAVDAGVAAVFAQAVTEFDRFGFGGEVPILVYSAERGKTLAISGQGQAPPRPRSNGSGSAISKPCRRLFLLPATVPAVPGTLIRALDEFGTMPLAEVLAPAIRLAEEGFPAYPSLFNASTRFRGRIREEWPSSAKIFLPGGKAPQVGDIFVSKRLGAHAAAPRLMPSARRRPRGARPVCKRPTTFSTAAK